MKDSENTPSIYCTKTLQNIQQVIVRTKGINCDIFRIWRVKIDAWLLFQIKIRFNTNNFIYLLFLLWSLCCVMSFLTVIYFNCINLDFIIVVKFSLVILKRNKNLMHLYILSIWLHVFTNATWSLDLAVNLKNVR